MKWTEHDVVPRLVITANVEHRGAGVVEQRKGYTVRTRGDVEKRVPHEYECPVHGRFVVDSENGSVPDSVVCPTITGEFLQANGEPMRSVNGRKYGVICCIQSPWCGSTPGIGIAAGEVTG